jgi:hypothetical protein
MNAIRFLPLGVLAFCLTQVQAQPVTSYPIYKEGVDLMLKVDALDVEHNYLRDKDGNTYCNVFAKKAADACGVTFVQAVANTQHDWLAGATGVKAGWVEVNVMEAQRRCNAGWFVLAAWKNTDTKFQGGHGHIAVVRPSGKDVVVIRTKGTDISQAGYTNYKKTDVATGFGNGRAWTDTQKQVRFFAYKLATSK